MAALFVGGFAMYGIGVYSFYLFIKPLSDEFHWSYAATGGLITAFFFAVPISLMTDSLIRRFSIRRLVISGIVIEALGLICFPMAAHLWQMYLVRALAGIGKILFVVAGPIILSKWFSRQFGIAIAIWGTGLQLGGTAFAPIAQHLIHALGWRSASIVLGVAVLAIALPPSLWMLRVESAAEIGLGLDGDALQNTISSTHSPRHDPIPAGKAGNHASLGELLQHRGFQLMVVAATLYYLTYDGVLALQATTLEAVGVSARMTSWVLGGTYAFAAAGALLGGYVVDRLSLTFTTAIQYLLMGLGVLALLMFIPVFSGWLLAIHTVAFGLAVGANSPFWAAVVRRKVPPEQFQRAWGIYYFVAVMPVIIAPIGAGTLYDLTGGFTAALVTELTLLAVSMATCVILVRRADTPA